MSTFQIRGLTIVGLVITVGLGGQAAPAAEPAAAGSSPAVSPPAVSLRNIVRNKLPADAKVIGLEFTVLKIDSAGREAAIDPEDHSFDIGDSFLVRIRPQDDVYVYVFTEGPDGTRACLLPENRTEPLLVKEGQQINLPDNGDVFTFQPPAGEEKLVVVAVMSPNPDLDLLAAAAFKEPGRKLSNTEREEQSRANAAIEGVRERGGPSVRVRGGLKKDRELRSAARQLEESRGQIIAAPDETTPHSEVVGVNTSEIIVDIPLRSQAAARQ